MDYKKILEGVVNIINTTKKSDIGFANICAYIGENCPELKESEDEQHRKWILEYLYDGLRKSEEQFKDQFKSAIAWLEKQGCEKGNLSIDFVLGYLGIKPAYKDGNAWCILLGDNIQEGICGFGDTKEEALIAFIKELIEKQSEKKPTNLAKGEDYGIDGLYNAIRILEKTLGKVDGYQTDDGILEHECAISAVKKLYEQKPAWSEENEVKMKELISYLVKKKSRETDGYAIWLKFLKFRLLSPSMREFDKEEGSIIDHLIAICDDAMCYDTFAGCSKKDIEKYKNFLTNLKFGINPQLQTTWKPSDAQMDSIDCAVRKMKESACYDSELVSLFNDLKKL